MKISVFYDLVIAIIILQLSLTKFGVILVANHGKRENKQSHETRQQSLCVWLCIPILYYGIRPNMWVLTSGEKTGKASNGLTIPSSVLSTPMGKVLSQRSS